ncbi:selenide, water dikinase SelD [Clostridium intestinale]|uniref:Selenide, water dikinase n=1 Tax=Clostridium intestinale DSM 6191 TaxID=1121320 RepID=A0A1M5YGB0_9CLOT|nr:selenide, water dikinase SelD [Clostridium intestinale]SHI10939.1 selenophosphate synthase [Clostridium intestinale DSM 6191]
MSQNNVKFTCGGGCTAKLGPGMLKSVLDKIPNKFDENLLIGFDSSDDGAVYKLTDDIAIIQTLDFFTPIVEDPYTFGKIAAANALSDVYAMGGEVKVALNIVGFPEKMEAEILGEILRGGAEKVHEAGGVVSGGHSINDPEPKYGLSVTGVVHPSKILPNNNCKIGDKLILTKPLGVGIITTAHRVGEASEEAYNKAIKSMETLNKYAADKMKKYKVNACTDVTGFGFLGHLNEMIKDEYSIKINGNTIPYIKEAYDYAKEFLITAGGQRNRRHLKDKVLFKDIEFPLEEILFDPQTSGGLLISLSSDEADDLLKELQELDLKSEIVGEVIEKQDFNIIIEKY